MSKQKNKKHFFMKCLFCNENNYSLLDVHRIIPGEKGGKYHNLNTVVVCCNHHRAIHSGSIVIDRKYLSTDASWVVHCWIDGEEQWLKEQRLI